jgi:hypothetical protein
MSTGEKRGTLAALALALAALASGAGCPSPDNGGPPLMYPADAGTNVVTLTTIDTFQSARGDEDVAEPKLDQNIGPRAYVLRDGDESPRLVEYGSGADGSYALHLPDAKLGYAAYRDAVVVGASGSIDFGEDIVGRADVRFADPGSTIHVSGDGVLPWRGSDWIVAAAFNSFGYAFVFSPSDLPAVGATALDDVPLDWSYGGLLSPSHGDELFVMQMRFDQHADGSELVHYPSVLRASDLVQGSGATTLHGSFAAATPATLHLDARFADFAEALREDHLLAVYGHVDVEPRPFGKGDLNDLYETTAQLYRPDDANAVVDLDYENPFPAEWPEIVAVSARSSRSFLLPGTTDALAASIDTGVALARADAEAGAHAPTLGAPRNVKLDGRSAYDDLTAVGDAPVISWDAPALGTPDGYRVEVLALRPYDTFTFDEAVVTYYTTRTSFQMLPGVLEAGKTYYLRVVAMSGEGVDVLHAPRKLPPTLAWAGALSGTFTR